MYSSTLTLSLLSSLVALASTTPTPDNAPKDKWAFQPSTLGLITFDHPDCNGDPATIINPVYYGQNYDQNFGFSSYQINRTLTAGEQLDISTYAQHPITDGIDLACHKFLMSAVPNAGPKPMECQNLGGLGNGNCFRLWIAAD